MGLQKMPETAIDVNQTITKDKTSIIRNYTTQPRLSMDFNKIILIFSL